jgi:hypothetical protein
LATWQLLEYTSRTVVRLIEAHLAVAMPGSTVEVRLATPHSFLGLRNVTKSTITVFLYRVSEHSELRNAPQPRAVDGSWRRQPLALECSYLITTWGARGGNIAGNDAAASLEEHKLLGVVMQGLYDRAEVGRADLYDDLTKPPVWGDSDTVEIALESLPIEDLYRIWDSSELAYQLSATYRVRVLGLESSRVFRGAPVVDASFKTGRP